MKFSKKQIISFIVISIIIAAIPPTIYLLQQKQIIKSNALEPTALCTPDPNNPGSIPPYSYTPGALEIYVSVIETNEAINPIPGVYLRADKIDNNPGTGDNRPINDIDGAGCGFSAEGITDALGHVNLEPLNCAHNNFKVSHGSNPSGLPPDVEFDSLATQFQKDGNDPSFITPDISNLPLDNGYAGILKLFYRRRPSVQSTPTPTPTPPGSCIGRVCTCSETSAGSCDQCNGGWCKGGFCETCSPATTPTPTPPSCPVPNAVTNIRIDCPYCP